MFSFTANTFATSQLWISFIVGVCVLLLVDLFVLNRNDHVIKLKEALWVSAFWIVLALGFNAWIWLTQGRELGTQFLTGYLVEKSLSVDNLFVILLVFKAFKIPAQFQHRVLFWGILGAVVFRGILIFVGAELVHNFEWILYIFGAILVYSGLKFLRNDDNEEVHVENGATRLLKKYIRVTPDFHGNHFFVRLKGQLWTTPLFFALCVIEISDIVFAVDSIPAVFAVTNDSFIAFSSNISAVLGLRALYFVVADSIARFKYLKPGLAAILIFVGGKMLLLSVGIKIPSEVSLAVIVGILVIAGGASWLITRKEQNKT